jgi:hypothetical protein
LLKALIACWRNRSYADVTTCSRPGIYQSPLTN